MPTDEDCPLPLKYLDVMRFTKTDIPEKSLKEIEDYWTNDQAHRDLGLEWTGATRFTLLKPKLKEK